MPDIHEYLPPATLEWCAQTLSALGINTNTLKITDLDGEGNRVHVQAYQVLSTALRDHMQNGSLPYLFESQKPEGGYKEVASRNGAFNAMFEDNKGFRQFVQSSGVTFQVPVTLISEVPLGFVGDTGEDRGWSTRPLDVPLD